MARKRARRPRTSTDTRFRISSLPVPFDLFLGNDLVAGLAPIAAHQFGS